jgi:hypothetical protein
MAMAREIREHKWAQVLGTFDLEAGQAQITSVQPAIAASRSIEGGEERIRLKGFDQAGRELFDLAVNPMHNSCAPRQDAGTFEEFIPVTDALQIIKLFVDGQETADFVPGHPVEVADVQFGVAPADKPHMIPLSGATAPADNVSYTVQARPAGEALWQTVGIGLPTVEAAAIDINQFPGAEKIEVRILQNNGLSETEIYRGDIQF